MFSSSNDTDAGEERGMNEITATGEPATELERLITELSDLGGSFLSSAPASAG
jgi:hypothetical protein